ncbi:hypothetical protein LXL04_033884 [Taraxacum kok-saghyz]
MHLLVIYSKPFFSLYYIEIVYVVFFKDNKVYLWNLEVKVVAEEMGIGFIGIGFQPKLKRKDIPIMRKVNLDFSYETDMIRKFRVGLALQPVSMHVL